jgi:hypothetical protein
MFLLQRFSYWETSQRLENSNMQIRTSVHARQRLKERFDKCPSFGGKLNEANLEFVQTIPKKQAQIYKYKWCSHPMYLFIGDDKSVITVLTPAMYKGWKKRWAIRQGLEKIIRITGIPEYQTMGIVPKIINFFAPHID